MLENKINAQSSAELAREEERISKQKVIAMFEQDMLADKKAGTIETLMFIHKTLFEDIYYFAGKIRTVNIAKGSFRFAPVMYLEQSLKTVEQMPQKTFDDIVAKYVEMNICHPFREGNGRATRIWLDHIFKSELKKVVDWSLIDKEDYLLAMERSPIRSTEINVLLKNALTEKTEDREVFMKGIDTSYYYEGYTAFDINDLR
ncbi:protein adenylyltransferase Fic [Ruminococcus albus]|uniref:protein adenylyltransferase n=1 Tax=Ruminococcus albus TaxID=1264 RepID=A0A1I1GTV7_RUMAL|nr:Fic family protein [Ruminococcus albus]SFC14941.1 cell filamentation protein [Ruminococcus albus]